MEKIIFFGIEFEMCAFNSLSEMNRVVFEIIKDKIYWRNPLTNEDYLLTEKNIIFERVSDAGEFKSKPFCGHIEELWPKHCEGIPSPSIRLEGLPSHMLAMPSISTSEIYGTYELDLHLNFSADSAISRNPDKFNKDEIAQKCVDYGKEWFPIFKPQYGWVDLGSQISPNKVKKVVIERLPWVSFFGPNYVEKYGKDFLLGIPAYKTGEIDGGGVFVQLSRNFTDKSSYPPFEKLAEYMAQKGIKLKPYSPKEMWI